MAEDKMNARIIRALEIAPQAEVPADFAAKVAALVPTHAKSRLAWGTPGKGGAVLPPGRYGRWAVVACLVMLPGLLLAFTRAAGTSPYWFLTEAIFIVPSVLLALWLAALGDTSVSTFWAD
jgi:hypothetical protein